MHVSCTVAHLLSVREHQFSGRTGFSRRPIVIRLPRERLGRKELRNGPHTRDCHSAVQRRRDMASGVSHRAAKHGASLSSSRTPSRGDGELVLPAMPRAETCNSLVISYQRTTELDCGSNQQPIRRIAVFKMMQLVAAGCSLMA